MCIYIRKTAWMAIAACLLLGRSEIEAQAPIRGFPTDALAERARLEAVLRGTPDATRLDEYMLTMSEEPHHAGSPGARRVAEYALDKFRSWGLDAEIEEFEALLPFPTVRRVELVAPTRFEAVMQERPLAEDKDSGDRNQLPTYNAYAADGDVTGDLVFANYGRPEDYAWLDRRGIDLSGKIVIVKYGLGVRSAKIKQAAERGAVGCIIYSEPEDDGYYRGDVYPKGPWRPEDGVQRGTAADYAAAYPGDPLTPGWGSKPGGRKLDRDEAPSLPSIPVVPISYGDATPLLEALGGPLAPNDDWKGVLPLTYHVGPGPARVRIQNESDWQNRPLYNVIVKIPGAVDPDQWVLYGNHHDAWVNGAQDPLSGAVALMESARGFSELLQAGWRPRRTIVFALWDGEEWGLLGSTEWAEYHADELDEKLVAYLNTDGYTAGSFVGGGSHALETYLGEVSRDVPDPLSGRSVLEHTRRATLAAARTAADTASVMGRAFPLRSLGSGSDFETFLERLGVSTLSLSFSGAPGPAGGYHSIYDSYTHFTRFLDPGFTYGVAQAKVLSTATVRLADARILPFSFTDAAGAYRSFARTAEDMADRHFGPGELDLEGVYRAVNRLEEAGMAFDRAVNAVLGRGSEWLDAHAEDLRAVNRAIYRSERDLLNPDGLPEREWFRHVMYATGLNTGFGADPMPGLLQTIKWNDMADAQAQAEIIIAAVERLTATVEAVSRSLMAL